MISFLCLPFFWRSVFGVWTLCLCCTGIFCILYAASIKRYRSLLLSVPILAASYVLWQVISCLNLSNAESSASVSIRLGRLPWQLWLLTLLLLSLAAVWTQIRSVRFRKTCISPMAIKLCGDEIDCGLCYWRDNGHVLFSNKCMNRLCIELTDAPLINGNRLRDAAAKGTMTIGGRVWRFTFRDLNYNGSPLHELIAYDVTAIHEKTETLKKDTEEIARLNKELKAYSLIVDETVRRQETLQAKKTIHDEMNRLMLSTAAVDISRGDNANQMFALWEKNAMLLCLEAGEKELEHSLMQVNRLAEVLNLKLIWRSDLPGVLTEKQRELFFIAANEAIVNAVKHAAADTLEISFTEIGSEITCCFENRGRLPDNPVLFTGGLASLAVLSGEQCVSVTAKTGDTFCLSLRFPVLRR